MPTVNGERLWNSLEEVSRFGETPAGGLTRLAGSIEDGQARDYVVAGARQAGCTVRIDAVGNIYLRRVGQDAHAPAVLFGSHLDSQPLGGKYDGVYGVMAGLEVLRALAESQTVTNRSVELVVWTNEEGARFAPAMMGAAVFAQRLDSTTALGTVDTAGVSVREALTSIDYLGTDVVSSNEFAAYLETHIEQGPSLEASKTDVGIVTGVQGMRWHRLRITGVPGHAGTYPLETRSDALVAAAHVIAGVREAGLAYPAIARATVGWLEVEPNSPNVIPGVVRMNVEFRHPDPAVLDALSATLDDLIGQACEAHGVDVINERVLDAAPVLFDQQLLGVLESAANQAGVTSTRMMSGAGHDAVQVSHVVPTAMLFIPCVDGVSHAEHERITPEWATAGAQVLLNAVLSLANG